MNQPDGYSSTTRNVLLPTTCFAANFVSLLQWDQPDGWPPLFGSISEVYSLRRFWGVFGHQLNLGIDCRDVLPWDFVFWSDSSEAKGAACLSRAQGVCLLGRVISCRCESSDAKSMMMARSTSHIHCESRLPTYPRCSLLASFKNYRRAPAPDSQEGSMTHGD